ncbi:MAG TPA: pseudouridine synthase [Polyangia bacterium]
MTAARPTRGRPPGRVSLNRALSKLGIASRAEATRLIAAGRVTVDGRVVRDPAAAVVPERAVIAIDGQPAARAAWRTLLLHKPRGVLTTRADPGGRPTVFDLLGEAGAHLVPVGRLDLATTGLLLLTTDTRFAAWATDPASAVPRLYVVTVRGEVSDETAARLTAGVEDAGERLAADAVTIRKRSRRETHLLVRLREGKNRELRRLFAALGHEVTRLTRVAFGGLELGALAPGAWRPVSVEELRAAFPGAPLAFEKGTLGGSL